VARPSETAEKTFWAADEHSAASPQFVLIFVGQVGNLPADVNRPLAEPYRNIQQADLQSAAGYQPAPQN